MILYNDITFMDALTDGSLNLRTFTDLHLMLAADPKIASPEVDSILIDVPGLDGKLDLTTALDGLVHYKTRKIEYNFICIEDRSEWRGIIKNLLEKLHGKRLIIFNYDDADYYYQGTVTVGNPDLKKDAFLISITVDADACKYEKVLTRYSFNLPSKYTGTLTGSDVPVIPSFNFTGNGDVAMIELNDNGKFLFIRDKDKFVKGLTIMPGDNIIKIIGDGWMVIEYHRKSM